MTTPFNLKTVKPQIEQIYKNGKMYETRKIEGKIQSVSIYQDLNGNGKFDKGEMIQVDRYFYDDNGTLRLSETYYDKDHDGYHDDKSVHHLYDDKGELVHTSTSELKGENSISEIKKRAQNGRCCDKTALRNYEMESIRDFEFHVCY